MSACLRLAAAVALVLALGACAQVPKESAELSATVGRDLAEMRRAHIALIDLYYERQLRDIDRFVDDVYVPFQVQRTLADPALRQELLRAVEEGAAPGGDGAAQQRASATRQASRFCSRRWSRFAGTSAALWRSSARRWWPASPRATTGSITPTPSSPGIWPRWCGCTMPRPRPWDASTPPSCGNGWARAAEISDRVAELTADSRAKDTSLARIVAEFERMLADTTPAVDTGAAR